MEENFKIENCSENDALEFGSGTYRVKKMINSIKSVFNYELIMHLNEKLKKQNIQLEESHCWFGKGINCEILRVGSTGWKRGKVRLKLSLEFISNEPEKIKPESPLDEYRKKINQ